MGGLPLGKPEKHKLKVNHISYEILIYLFVRTSCDLFANNF